MTSSNPSLSEVNAALDTMRHPINETSRSGIARFMFYGDKYAGKTTLIATILKALNHHGLILTSDSSYTIWEKPEFLGLVDRIPLEGLEQIKHIVKRIGSDSSWDYDWIIIDPFSTAVNNYTAAITEAKKFKDQLDPDASSWTHYNITKTKVTQVLDTLNPLNIHICFITHLADKAGEQAVRANLPGQSYEVIARNVNLIGYIRKIKAGDPTNRKIALEPTPRATAGTQIPGIPEGDYTFDEFTELVVNWIKG